MFKKLLKPLNLLIVSLVIILVASLSASLVQNSFFSVKVSNISFETDNGELAGLLYLPRGVDADSPAPAIITTHGYLNNKEMQEIAAIELSRRGYVVLAFDMYDHGDSVWDTPAAFSFFNAAVYDAVQYMYDQDYVLKDASGNGMIGVSGHSMGGFSAEAAVVYDEIDFASTGIRKIATMLALGSDFRYIWIHPDPISMMGPRTTGIVAAHYDQFFFDNVTPGADGSVRYKDFVKDPVGLQFLGRTAEGTAEAGVFYAEGGGNRVIYTPDETHPQNTWSLETGRDTFEFFNKAFSIQLTKAGLGDLESHGINVSATGQSWWLKEAFTLVAIIGLVMFMIALFPILSGLPVFNKVNMKLEEATGFKVRAKEKNIVKVVVVILATLVSANYLKPFMDRSLELVDLAKIIQNLTVVTILVVVLIWIGAIIVKGAKGGENPVMDKIAGQATLYGGVIVLISVCYRWFLINTQLYTNLVKWGAPSTNTIIYWAMASAGLILLVTVITSLYFNQGEDVKNPFGLNTTPIQLAASLLNAVVMVIVVLFVVALTGWVFKTDFRFYTFAIQIFNWPQLAEAIKYIPGFFVYYLAAGILVFANTRNIKRGWLGDIYAAFLLAGPIVLFLMYNYRTLYNTGVAAFPTFSLSAILVVGLVAVLSIAGIILRRFSLKTGNIWTGVFFTAIFFTIITLANTIIYQLVA